MKISYTIAATIAAGLGGLIVANNPNSEAYEKYAAEKLSTYLIEKGCTQLSAQTEVSDRISKFIAQNCRSFVQSNRPQIQKIIASNTKRQNWLFFSIYRTDLDFAGPIPDYHFETVGGLQNFYLYQAKKL